MAYSVQKVLPSAQKMLESLPISPEISDQIARDRTEIQNILSGRDPRKMLIVGPCSAWPSESVVEYFEKLKKTAEKVSPKLKIIGRVYIQKPRTTTGWLGPVNQPDPFADPDVEKGLIYCRKMMIEILKLGFPIADEAVFTHKKGYLMDLPSWIAIGARSTEDQEHRIFASLLDCPVGLKNPTSGSISIGINSIVAAQHPHVFVIDGQQVQTSGNAFAHLILRGGSGKPNFQAPFIEKAIQKMHEKNVQNPAILVDASHENCLDPETGKKNPRRQPEILDAVLESARQNPEIARAVKGFMVESFLEPGNQNVAEFAPSNPPKFGQSITDPCLSLPETIEMMESVAGQI